VALTRFDQLGVDDLPSRVAGYSDSGGLHLSDDPAELTSLADLEKRYIRHVLAAVHGNKSAAARILGLDRKTLYRKLDGTNESSDSTS